MRYGRAYFYISNLKEGAAIAKRSSQSNTIAFAEDRPPNEYEVILEHIIELLNTDPTFSGYVKAEKYEFTKKAELKVLHVRGIKKEPTENMS